MTIALAGNPNSGKTTLFNALTGSNQFVGNWPGVTVEKKEGLLKGYKDITITDLPGIYSLSPYTPEEIVARNYLLDEQPDVILNIIDGNNFERNLFLTTQLIELAIPVVIAINMIDIVEKKGNRIYIEKLSKELLCPVIEISALRGSGIKEVAELAVRSAYNEKHIPKHCFSGGVEHTLAHIEEAVLHNLPQEKQRFFSLKLFERDENIIGKLCLTLEQVEHIDEDIQRREYELDDDSESIIITERYRYIDSIIGECAKLKRRDKLSASDKIDKIVTNRILAIPIFIVVMFIVYYVSITTVGTFATDWANDGVFGEGWKFFGVWVPGVPVILGNLLETIKCADWLQDLILNGVVAGVGAVLSFVPQIFILFAFLAFLEACGYMSRIAFIMDKIFKRFGLSGKSFIPILIGTGCSVPGIMASRTIENDKERKMTIMTTSFIPCSAKLPIIALIAGSVFGNVGWVAVSAYFVGIIAIICSGVILKKTKIFSGESSPFVMELPPYHLPTILNILRSVWERGWSFIKKAGTIILLATILVWFASNFGFVNGKILMVEMGDSFLAKIGGFFAPLFIPLGWGKWQTVVATITGLIAKENVVGTFGVFYNYSETGILVANNNTPAFSSSLAAYSFLIFNLLCTPCFAAVGAIRREMNNKRWFWAAIGYQSAFAYAVSFCIYHFGILFTGNSFTIFTAISFILSFLFLFLIFRPLKKEVLV